MGEGDIKATDFLTSLAALVPHLQPLCLGSRGWGWERARESGEEGSALSSPKSQASPATFLAHGGAWRV